MFMFRKKDTTKSTAAGFVKEAKKFQSVVKEINETVKPSDLTIDVINAYAKKNNLEANFLAEAFETYLKQNALTAVRRIKASDDYTILNLEKAVEAFGFELDDLNITYFSEE